MRPLTTLNEAKNLLDEIKQLIKRNGLLYANHRAKNAQFIADLGITSKQQKSIINNLEPDDYCSGPEADEKYNWKYIAVFGAEYAGTEIYIKFSVGNQDDPVVCISFHEAAIPLVYRFK